MLGHVAAASAVQGTALRGDPYPIIGCYTGPMRPEPVALDPDPVIEAYKRDVDRTLLRENLKLSPEARLLKLQDFVRFTARLREERERP